jgi:hypothetical protein
MNVTYYLGAGASAEKLPTYANFKAKVEEFKKVLPVDVNLFKNKANIENFNQLKQTTEWVFNELENHKTPDTLAKKLFHKGSSDKLDELKVFLILFFSHLQRNSKTDLRYDSFIASILKPTHGFNFYENFNIISWNYDLQFEYTYSKYHEEGLNHTFHDINISPNIFANVTIPKRKKEEFSIVHLNGIANTFFLNDGTKDSFLDNHVEYVEKFCEEYYKLRYQRSSAGKQYLNYAWETKSSGSHKQKERIDEAIDIAQKTDILVIIGYSFPIFNDEIDNQIIGEMTKLEKVYVQDDNRNLRDRLVQTVFNNHQSKIQPDKIEWIEDTKSFLLPPEWNK